MSIVSANKLSSLFKDNQRLGQSIFPELIKRLIIASANCNWIRFPSGDSIWAQSFDGIVKDIKDSCGLVPQGNSVWELGTDQTPSTKANTDFTARSNKRTSYNKTDYTFVFCTPHVWNSDILQWETEKKALKKWKGVKIIDATMLADWLNSNMEIAIWLLNSFNERTPIDGIVSLEQEIKRVYELTEPNMTNQLLICSNENQAKELVDSLASDANRYNIIKATTNFEQGYFFVLAALAQENNAYVNSKIIIAKSREGLQAINNHCRGKIILLSFDDIHDTDYNEQNKYVNIVTDKIRTPTIKLSPIFFDDFSKALESMGFSAIDASQITSKVNRNISCFKRRCSSNPAIKKPLWAEDNNRNDIIPIALLSEINVKNDSEIVGRLIDGTFQNYIERLDFWLNKEDSPIFKVGDTYRIYAKEEAIKVLGLLHNSPKVLSLMELCKNKIFVTKNARFEKKPEEWYIIDHRFKYSDNLIRGILNSLAILSNDKNSQTSLDFFICDLLRPMKTDAVLLHTFVSYFSLMSEISSKAIHDFVNEALDNDTIIKNLLQGYGTLTFHQSSNFINLYWAIKQNLYRKDCALDAQRILLKLYLKDYQSPNKEQIDNEIIESFAPILSCEYALTPTDKMNILFLASKNFDERKILLAEKIFYKMRWGQVDNYMSSSKPTWKEYKKYDSTYYPQEFALVNDKATEWLYESASDKVKLFSKVLDIKILSNADESLIEKTFEELNDKLICKLTDSETKRLLNIKADELMKRHRSYANQDKKVKSLIVEKLKEVFQNTLPKDLFERHRNLFEREHLDIFDSFEDEGKLSYQEMNDRMIKIMSGTVCSLITEQGNVILDRLIEITHDNNYLAWKIIFEFSQDKLLVMEKLIALGKNTAFIRFIEFSGEFHKDMQALILSICNDKQKNNIIQNLPLIDDAIEFAELHNFEKMFWSTKHGYFDNISDKIYKKMLIFCPINLLSYLLYNHEDKINYDKSLEVLRGIISFHNSASAEEISNAWRRNSLYHCLVELIDGLDKKFYTDELAECEFQLLNIYMSGHTHDMYPRGVQEYFWRNPNEYYKLFKELLFAETKDLPSNSLAKRMIFQAIQPFGTTCAIPTEYILSKSEEFKNWSNSILEHAKKDGKKFLHKFCKLVINIIGLCPETKEQVIWLPQAIADVLDAMADHWSKEDMQEVNDLYKSYTPIEQQRNITKEEYIAHSFTTAKINTRGAHFVGNGSYEFEMAEKYSSYAEHYKITNPITYEGLRCIASHYQRDGEDNRKQSIYGRHYSD